MARNHRHWRRCRSTVQRLGTDPRRRARLGPVWHRSGLHRTSHQAWNVTKPPNSAILLTPRPPGGGSAIAVIRIRGSGVPEFLQKFFSRPPSPEMCVHGELRDGQSTIDDCLVVLDRTGNWADICLHGGSWVIESTLKLARREGFEIIDSKLPVIAEAFDEAADELEREVLQYLPMALTEPAIRMLLNQPAAWRKEFDPAA